LEAQAVPFEKIQVPLLDLGFSSYFPDIQQEE